MSTAAQVHGDIKNVELADLGKKRIEWANQSMKVLQIIRKEFIKNQPLKGIRVSACLHVTGETTSRIIRTSWRRSITNRSSRWMMAQIWFRSFTPNARPNWRM